MILLTGGTGLVGSEWLLRLPHSDVIAVGRRPDRIHHAVSVYGDLAQSVPVSPDQIEVILHCAADIRFNATLEESRANNLVATENLLRFAERCPKLRKFVFVSTVYLAGDREGEIEEAPVLPTPRFFSSYEQTKHEAEQVVFDAMSRLPICVLRLSSVIGALNGEVKQWNYFHQLLRLAPANPLPLIPARPDALVDIIPIDWAVDVMDYLVHHAWKPGSIFHICAGPDHASTVGKAFAMAYPMLGRAAVAPKMGSFDECEKFYAAVGGRRAEIWQTMRTYLPHLGLQQIFKNDRCKTALQGSGIDWSPAEAFLARVIHQTLARRNAPAPVCDGLQPA